MQDYKIRLGCNPTVAFYLKKLDRANIKAMAKELQSRTMTYEEKDVAAIWIEAVIVELVKQDLILKYKGD